MLKSPKNRQVEDTPHSTIFSPPTIAIFENIENENCFLFSPQRPTFFWYKLMQKTSKKTVMSYTLKSIKIVKKKQLKCKHLHFGH